MVEKKKTKRPRSAKYRTLPPDAKSLVMMILTVDEDLRKRGKHLVHEFHDLQARRGVRTLFEQRAAAWQKLATLDRALAIATAAALNLRLPASFRTEVLP